MNVETAIIKPPSEQDQKKEREGGYFDVKLYATIRYSTPTAMAFWKKRELNSDVLSKSDVDKLSSIGRGKGDKPYKSVYSLSQAESKGSIELNGKLIEEDGTLKTDQYEIIINGYGDYLAKTGLKKFKDLANEQPNGPALISKFHKTRPDLNEQQIPYGIGHDVYDLTKATPDIFNTPELNDMREFLKNLKTYIINILWWGMARFFLLAI